MLRGVERGENDFTSRARRLKITLIEKQGGFKVPLDQLQTFEDCFVRSQYEMHMIATDLKDVKDQQAREQKIKARREAALKALEIGLTKPDAQPNAQGKNSYEVNTARLSLAYHFLQSGKNKVANQAAEALARSNSRAGHAPTAAAYAMQAHAQYIAEREQKVASKDDLQADRNKMLEFAKFAEETWPDELPANLARHQVGLLLIREKQLEAGLKQLLAVTPSYTDYARVRYQIADACLVAEKEKREPFHDAALGSYSQLAMKALLSIPEGAPAAPDPAVNYYFYAGRIRIGQEYFKEKKYAEMDALRSTAPGQSSGRAPRRQRRAQHAVAARHYGQPEQPGSLREVRPGGRRVQGEPFPEGDGDARPNRRADQ